MNKERLLTAPEAERFRTLCNFTEDERRIFDLRVKDLSVVQIAMTLNLSERSVYRRLDAIRKKTARV